MSQQPMRFYWPLQSDPRKTQLQVMEWIEKLPLDIKYILCEIPVGGGKSPLAINFSHYIGNGIGDSYILTPQKILQKQYEDSFDNSILHSLYGKNNYECKSKKTNCEIGDIIKPKCDSCPHKAALGKAQISQNVVMNYHLALLHFKYMSLGDRNRRRKLMIFDECHNIENILTEFNSIYISEDRCKKLNIKFNPNLTNLEDASEWVKTIFYPALLSKISKLSTSLDEYERDSEVHGSTLPKDAVEMASDLKDFKFLADNISSNIIIPTINFINESFVFIPEKTSFKFKELYGKRNFQDILEPKADRFLFLSSTILNKHAFCNDLGLDPAKTAFISMDSEFAVENRPILFMPTASMTYGWDGDDRKTERNMMIDCIKNLLAHHNNQSGVIHTGSFKIAEWLVSVLNNNIEHDIYHHNPTKGTKLTRDEVIDSFIQNSSKAPSLLISPSVTEGLDLKDDLARFAIFAKVPFPFLGDAWVKKRMQLSQEWYNRQAMIAIIQGSGRHVRTPTDWGETYILDSSFQQLYNRTKQFIPKWWKNALSVE